ncbi:MAG: polyprenyl synthetase family protein, partial [bacterium]|nr:polyprenyl synthetase family protein [bacterium]
GVAVLAGDGLLSFAFELLCRGECLEVIRDVAQATGPSGMVGGQVLDLKAEGVALTVEALENVHRFKTGRLISVSVTGGAKIGGADAAQLETLKSYGDKIGLAFQIADDILNVEGDAKTLGKSVGSDAKNCKSTYPALLGLQASKAKARELVSEAIAALDGFTAAADPLRGIAEYVVLRKN